MGCRLVESDLVPPQARRGCLDLLVVLVARAVRVERVALADWLEQVGQVGQVGQTARADLLAPAVLAVRVAPVGLLEPVAPAEVLVVQVEVLAVLAVLAEALVEQVALAEVLVEQVEPAVLAGSRLAPMPTRVRVLVRVQAELAALILQGQRSLEGADYC